MKKGFTLIELLAVIVILAMIALIATPVILGIIDEAKRSAFKDAAYGLEHAAELLYAENVMEQKSNTIIFTYKDGVESSSPEGFLLNYKGEKPKNGQIVLEKDGTVRMSLHNGKYCVTKTSLGDVVLEEKKINKCSLPDLPKTYRFTKDNSKAPAPELASNMIAIVRDNNKWVKADSSIQEDWYNYEAKVWANAVTVTESSRSKYLNAEVGMEIKEEDILTYLVWIPRYKYKLFNVESIEMEAQTIEVLFEDKNKAKSNGSNNGEYLTHPAFTFGDMELNGIWVGKFKTTGSMSEACINESCETASLTIKSNMSSVRNQTLSSMFYASRSMQRSGNAYGFTSSVDVHVMKNTEWGAVAYLTNSKYGKNSEVWINNNQDYITGCVGSSVSAEQSTICENIYTSTIGMNGSTTGNTYGVYDMSGGAWEYVMGAMYNSDNSTIYVYTTGFNQSIIDGASMSKYIDKYTYGTTNNDQTAWNRRKFGDATGETHDWYSDNAVFINSSASWFIRGGHYNDTTNAGVFNFSRGGGNTSSYVSFRVVISPA